MADTVLTDLKIHDFDSLAQMSQHESEIGDNDLVLTPDLSCRLPLLTPMWFDHIANDVSWLRADTFSWHSGSFYESAYKHLADELKTEIATFGWVGDTTGIVYATKGTPSEGDSVIGGGYTVGEVGSDYIAIYKNGGEYEYATRNSEYDSTADASKTDTIGDITITYYTAEDGHKICLPDQESNIVALYEKAGVAWYYLLDTVNKQFKLPRTQWGFTGLRDSVGGYVEPGLPNITAKFRTGSWKTDAVSASTSGAATQTNGGNAKAYEGGTNAYTYVDTAIDANRSSAIYGASDTVQPPATQMYLYFYVGNFGQSTTEQTAGLNAELFNNKADVGFGNVSNAAKELMANSSMPSGTYINLTLGSSGSTYTAPADGWVTVSKVASGNQHMSLSCNNLVDTINVTNGSYATVKLPVKKGDTFKVSYTLGGATNHFRFIYAEGCKHLA